MQSIVSQFSVNNNPDIAPLDELEDMHDIESNYDVSEHMSDFTAQLDQLTNSLSDPNMATPMNGSFLEMSMRTICSNMIQHNHLCFQKIRSPKPQCFLLICQILFYVKISSLQHHRNNECHVCLHQRQ